MFVFKEIDNWISDDTRLNIKSRIEGQRHNWKHIRDFPLAKSEKLLAAQNPELYKSAENQYFLGDATYVLERLDQRNLELTEVLNRKFEDLYSLIQETLNQITGVPTSYLDSYPRPGFHIFRGKQTPHPFEWHLDTTICRYDTNFKPEECYSFLSLIESPISDPAGLEYKDTANFDEINEVETKIKFYEPNKFYYWKGDHYHRMKRFGMNDGESRITLQGHYVISKYGTYIYW